MLSLSLSLSLSTTYVAPAYAADAGPPPLPVWVNDDDGGDDPDPGPATDDVEAGAGIGDPAGRPDCGDTVEPPLQDWSDASRAVASVVHPDGPGTELWLIGTARIGAEVVHWRQGPYVSTGQSEDIPVLLPAQILSQPAAVGGAGTVSMRVVARRDSGVVGSWSLPRLAWTLVGSRDGLPSFVRMSDWDWTRTTERGGETLASADL